MWQIVRAKESTTDRHVQCDDGKMIEFTRWEMREMKVSACELTSVEDAEEIAERKQAA